MIGKLKEAASNVVSKYSQKNDGIQAERVKKTEKYTYARPFFLGLDKDEVKCAQDFSLRPVIKPRKIEDMTLCCGYAECINGGKSDNNEDNAYSCMLQIKAKPNKGNSKSASADGKNSLSGKSSNGSTQQDNTGIFERSMIEIASHGMIHSPVAMYFGIFDGHAGYQTSLIVSRHLHQHVQEKLQQCLDLMVQKSSDAPPCPFDMFSNISIEDLIIGALEEAFQEMKSSDAPPCPFDMFSNISIEDLIIGALEEAFQEMDDYLESEGSTYRVKGGCTTLVVLLLEGKMYIANAGDSRAVLCHGDKVEQVSRDFNPVTDKQRINYIGHLHPDLLHNEFTCLEFPRRLNKNDVGQVTLCRKPGRDGWSYKTVDEDDLKFPLVTGEGKKARIMATIGVTRGLGDHDLYVFDSPIWIKPFLSCKPEVRVIDLTEHQWTEDDVLILGTDGLWDVITNQEAADIVHKEFSSSNKTDFKKYTIAAQELVSEARGSFTGQGWKKKNGDAASFDDITAMIIPIKIYLDQWRSGTLIDGGVT